MNASSRVLAASLAALFAGCAAVHPSMKSLRVDSDQAVPLSCDGKTDHLDCIAVVALIKNTDDAELVLSGNEFEFYEPLDDQGAERLLAEGMTLDDVKLAVPKGSAGPRHTILRLRGAQLADGVDERALKTALRDGRAALRGRFSVKGTGRLESTYLASSRVTGVERRVNIDGPPPIVDWVRLEELTLERLDLSTPERIGLDVRFTARSNRALLDASDCTAHDFVIVGSGSEVPVAKLEGSAAFDVRQQGAQARTRLTLVPEKTTDVHALLTSPAPWKVQATFQCKHDSQGVPVTPLRVVFPLASLLPTTELTSAQVTLPSSTVLSQLIDQTQLANGYRMLVQARRQAGAPLPLALKNPFATTAKIETLSLRVSSTATPACVIETSLPQSVQVAARTSTTSQLKVDRVVTPDACFRRSSSGTDAMTRGSLTVTATVKVPLASRLELTLTGSIRDGVIDFQQPANTVVSRKEQP